MLASSSRKRGLRVGGLAIAAALAAAAAAAASPDASVIAGAQIPAGTFSFAANGAAACTRHVATNGSDANSGASPGSAWRTVARAMATLQAGQTACVHAGTYDVATLDPAHSGTATAPITLRGAPGEARPVLRATNDSSLLRFGPGDAYWIVRGLDLNKNKRAGASVQLLGDPSAPAHHVEIRGNVIRDGKSGAAVLVRHAATDVLIDGNEIRDHHLWTNGSAVAYSRLNTSYRRSDANAINLEGTATGTVARVQVRGNHLHHNGGDGLQCLGVDDNAGPHAHDPADLDAVDNRIDHNAENALDIKSCQRVSIRGSRSPELPGSAANNKLFGYRPTDRTADVPGNYANGDAIVIHYFARHVKVANTRIWDSCRGIGVGRDDKNGVSDVVIRRTLIFGLVSGANCDGVGIDLVLAQRVDVFHNTLTGIPITALRVASANGGKSVSTDVDVFNNVFETSGSGYWLDLYRPLVSGFESDRNLLWNADGSSRHFTLDFNATTLPAWRSATGQDSTSRHGNPSWVADPANNDYFTTAGSPARDAALDNVGAARCGLGPDIGFRESGC